MTRMIGLRFAQLVLVLFLVSVLVFLLLELLPGDTATAIAANSGDHSGEAIAAIRQELGLDRPLPIRFADWLGGVLHGDFGASYNNGQDIWTAISERFPVSIQLIVLAELISLAVAVPLAIYVSQRRDGLADRITAALCFTGQAVPNFMLALLLILFLAVKVKLLPAVGYVPMSEGPIDSTTSILIPALALSGGLIPVYVRVLRNELVRTLQEDFILVGRSLGLPRWKLLLHYALKPASPTLITVVGVNIGTLLGGTVLVEVISGIPGLGTLMLTSIQTWDYQVVQGVVLVVAAVYVLCNFLVDMLHLAVDPRVRS
jgi:peptide/nickel transport system permease protein